MLVQREGFQILLPASSSILFPKISIGLKVAISASNTKDRSLYFGYEMILFTAASTASGVGVEVLKLTATHAHSAPQQFQSYLPSSLQKPMKHHAQQHVEERHSHRWIRR